jgi:ankyrin repeat protein
MQYKSVNSFASFVWRHASPCGRHTVITRAAGFVANLPGKAHLPDKHGAYPLHIAAREGASILLLAKLANENPSAICSRDSLLGKTPFNYLPRGAFDFITTRSDIRDDRALETHKVGAEKDFFYSAIPSIWHKAIALLEAAAIHQLRILRPTDWASGYELAPCNPLHIIACRFCISHRQMIHAMVRLYPEWLVQRDSDGNLPLHCVCSSTMYVPAQSRYCFSESRYHIHNLLLNEHSSTAAVRTSSGRFALALAARSGKTLMNGVQFLIDAFPAAVGERGTPTALYPCMLAALVSSFQNKKLIYPGST